MFYNIEMRKFAFTSTPIRHLLPTPHIHTHLELIYITEGQSTAILDNQTYTLTAGDIFLAFPNQIHFYHDKTPIKGHLVIFSPDILSEFKEIFQTKVPVSPIVKDTCIPMDVEGTFAKITEKLESGTPLDSITAKGYLLTLSGELFSHMELVNKPGDQETIKRILSYCIENYTEPLTLEHLAKELYLNKYYISHVFQERMHISYKDFITQLRVDHACDLLKKGSSATEAAYASGFSSVRTFNRAFSQYKNMTPRDYVKSIK